MCCIKQVLFFVLCMGYIATGMAQKNDRKYEALWKKVENLSGNKGLSQSALTIVNQLYSMAKKEHQDAQLIKALLYQLKLQENTIEDAGIKNIARMEKELQVATEPALSILNSLLAEKYLHYYQQYRWQLYNRTQTTGYDKSSVATWSIADFHQKISALYLASVAAKKLLQQTRLEPYDALIVKGNARYLRPTLYDLLAHQALEYFRNDERDITKPAYAFQIADSQYFADAAAFAKLKIVSPDSSAVHHKALLIFQQLLAFHAGDARPDALIDADILRIRFVYQYGVMENKEALYASAMEKITVTYGNEPAAAMAGYLLARWHAGKAGKYDPLKDESNRFEYMEAKKIAENIARQKENSEAKSNSLQLLKDIERKEIHLTTEKVNVPGQPFRTLVSYRNCNQLYLRIISLNANLKNQLKNRYDATYWKQLTELPAIRTWQQPLPATNDYQKHNAEIKIDALPAGEYLLLSSTDERLPLNNQPLAAQYFHVSNISYVNNGNEFFILNRDNGKPLAKAAVQLWAERYDYNTRQNIATKDQRTTTDQNGYCKLTATNRQENIRIEINYNNDRLFLDDNEYGIYRAAETEMPAPDAEAYTKENARVFFFTDRSIYRPGQTVHFKGIALSKDLQTKKSAILPRYKTVVKLYNTNGELADSLEVTTNEFGAYAGSFTLPQNMLNGQFRIADGQLQGDAYFSVEEYKRPKFYVEFEKVKGSYKVQDSITITGFAKAYAGNNINGAAITYRVVRQPRFIYPWLYWRWGIPSGSKMEITNGTTTSDDAGKFTIRFKAIPDLSIGKQFDPIFDYQVMAEVTDINGETRSAETTVPVSYKALQLKLTVPGEPTLAADSLTRVFISSKNLNGEFDPAFVHVTISTLQVPARLIRKRFWQQPDQFVMTGEAYQRLFPHDEYQNETDYRTWAKGEKMYDAVDSTTISTQHALKGATFRQGWYVIEVTAKDKYGEEVKDVHYIQLYDAKSKSLPSLQYAWATQDNTVIEPGAKATITIGSAADSLFIIRQVKKDEPSYDFIILNAEKKAFDFTAGENDRGGFAVQHFFVKNNRFYTLYNQVEVPWTNKDLTISYETFRDKTLPGSEEKWKLSIRGYKNEKVAAEMLVSMYDASLDQFSPHQWSLPDVWQHFRNESLWNGNSSFSPVQSQERYADESVSNPYVTTTYDRLIEMQSERLVMIRGNEMAQKIGRQVENYDDVSAKADVSLQGKAAGINASKNKFSPPQAVMDEETKAAENTPLQPVSSIPLRKNFNETAFFFPELKTDADGSIAFSFTLPESLTTWKLQGLAYTKDAAFGYTSKQVVTQKPLMVQPNVPRFLREGDRMELSTKIVNLTAGELTGTVQLELLNAATLQPVDGWFQNMTANQYFTAPAGKSVVAGFTIQVPYQFNTPLVYRFKASAAVPGSKKGQEEWVGDGEEAILPVLTNSMLVTESVPLPMRGNGTGHFRLEKLLQSGKSETLQQHALTVEFTTNPAWYAVQSLPYLAEPTYDCSEQAFNRFYANALATKIANAAPRLKAVMEKYLSLNPSPAKDPAASGINGDTLQAVLQKNPDLKAVLLEETPWVTDAKNDVQQKKNIAILFNMARMSGELETSLQQCKRFQSPNGGFVWFKGGPDDRFITQYILTGLGHLKKLNALPSSTQSLVNDIINSGIAYLDQRINEDHDLLLKSRSNLQNNHLGYTQVQYLYMRSFFPDLGIPAASLAAVNYFRRQSAQFWLQQNTYMQGMIALSLGRTGDAITAGKILQSLQQNAVINEETGMYWKDMRSGYYWYQAPVETQSVMIEAFNEIRKDSKTVDDLRTWLLKQKQTQHWPSTKSTADACYALLLQGAGWLNAEPGVEIRLGDKSVKSTDEKQEAGTGYFSKSFDGAFVNPAMGEISVTVKSAAVPVQPGAGNAPAQHSNLTTWGAVYWQYFEKLENITPAATPLKLVKHLFVEKNSATGPVLQAVHEGDVLKTGDKIKVRIELTTDRNMEYVHLKDMRAVCMEPVNVLSSYKWQGGLGYYETTRDASTSFFFNWLPKGTYVFEYTLFVTHTGNFSNGITSIQCLYAPEFSSHSEGIRINVAQ